VKIGIMFRDVSTSLFKRPITERYPFERREAPERLRGRLYWDPEKCTGCGLCAMDCPARAIKVHVLDKKEKLYVLEYHADRCTYCAQCVHSCRQGCLSLSNETWELANLTREPFAFYFGDPSNVERVLAGEVTGDTETP
jgi:formate hydrogenlyase subunit 6/NADH:ubiquinone oxidoreductase subunit I